MKNGAYFVIDGRDTDRPSPPVAWVTDAHPDPDSGLPRVELKFPTGLSGILVPVDSLNHAFVDDGVHVVLPTDDGDVTLVWARPLDSTMADDEKAALSIMLHESSPKLVEDIAAAQDVDDVQRTIYDYCCAEYPS